MTKNVIFVKSNARIIYKYFKDKQEVLYFIELTTDCIQNTPKGAEDFIVTL